MAEIWLDIHEAADKLECSTQNVAGLVRRKQLIAREDPIGGKQKRYMIRLDSIEKYIVKRETERPNWRQQGRRKRRK